MAAFLNHLPPWNAGIEMELLIIKKGDMYVRAKEKGYLFIGLDKASVFPMEKIETVEAHIRKLQEQGFEDVAIYRLKLSEELFIPNGVTLKTQKGKPSA